MTCSKDLLGEMKRAGYKLTPQRRAVVEAVLSADRSLTPQELYSKLTGKHPEIGLVTVYRTLDVLNSLGLLCQFQPQGNARSFKAGPPEHHHHLVCRGCGEVVDFTGRCPVELKTSLERETGFLITHHQLEFAGYCKDCRNK
ncbi:Fur family transcriptional regulator, ferric uptake regulator [Dehalogenimonas formicexedens]|uniref:Fur family transcriptional regulator, ferric uptake regulator n=1 Tax=Dehalogenimonas formicexedens TaxID=1839801 RepID=A0A1P8F526_9CHLR|nr:Fur family transcriptional regulator [Dehalogenimonas formicexedens]APV43530.1 Fur family transcriptional regulator, ferric uptake regulator [Dehalogenimonas formicexedens]